MSDELELPPATVPAPTPPTTVIFDGTPLAPMAPSIKAAIADAFSALPDGKRVALLAIADVNGTRGVVAAKIGEHWQVAAGTEFKWHEKKPSGYVAVQAIW